MEWYVYVLSGAFLLALADVWTKKLLFKEHSLEFLSTRAVTTLVLLLIVAPFAPKLPSWPVLLLIFFVSLTISISLWLEIKALKHLEISVMEPLFNLSPLFLVVFAYFFLGERLSWLQGVGVVCLIIGAYILEGISHKNLLAPLQKLFSSSPMICLLSALVLFSAVSTFEKYLFGHAVAALTYVYFVWVFICLDLIILDAFLYRLKWVRSDLKKYGWLTFLVSFLHLSSITLHLVGVSLAPVSLALPTRRLSTLFATFLGGKLYHEKGLSHRVLACCILLAGVILIII
ncbi:MAG: DMT family transporter [Nanoarchaeota archaeon]